MKTRFQSVLNRVVPAVCLSFGLAAGAPARAEDEPCVAPAKIAEGQKASVPLDFDADGFSDFGTVLLDGGNANFSVTLSSTGAVTTQTLAGNDQAVADYDGDFKADFATVSKQGNTFRWNIIPSATNAPATLEIGDSNSTPISGCRLVSPNRASAAAIDGKAVNAVELGTGRTAKVSLGSGRLKLLGCGDLDGDYQDELLFRSPGPDDSVNIVSIGCGKKPVVYRSVKAFRRAIMVPRAPGQLPLLAFFRNLRTDRFVLDVQGVSELVSFGQSVAGHTADIASALLKGPDGSQTPAILSRKPGSSDVFVAYVGTPGMEPVKLTQISDQRAKLLQSQTDIQ